MSFPRIIQILGMVLTLEALYFGIARDSMKLEILFLFIGGMIFYVGRIFERRSK